MNGQEGDFLYLIDSGLVKAQNFSSGGKSCLLNIYGADDLIGDSCLVQRMRAETSTTLTPAVVRKIPRARVLRLIADQELAEDWLRYQILRVLEQQETITLFVTLNSEQRLGSLLLALARKFGSRRDGRTWVENQLTQEDFAQMVGTTRSRVGSFLKNFRQHGLVRAAGNSLIIDEPGLHAYVAAREAPAVTRAPQGSGSGAAQARPAGR
jgi:CRP/FNR family transcriptional regulator, cyclic AMP receptor protein